MVKLNTNENPYPPSPAVTQAIQGIEPDALRRYPSPSATVCRETIARVHGLSGDQVIATNGGDELLRLAVTVFCQPRDGDNDGQAVTGGGVGIAHPGYSLYPVLAGIQDTPLVSVPLSDQFVLPDDFADRLNDAGCRLALLVNPHAPSGRLEPLDKLERVARRFKGVVLIDEAYVDFASCDALALLDPARGLDNVLLLRTLSKGYSLAGLRFGYGLAHCGLIEAMDKARDSYNTDVVSQRAAVAALENRDEAARTWQAVIRERDRLTGELTKRDFAVFPSQSNFLLAVPPRDARGVYEALMAKGVLVRYFDQDTLEDKLRITIGTTEENNALLAALDDL